MTKLFHSLRTPLLALALAATTPLAHAQFENSIDLPGISPVSSVSQQLVYTTLTVNYSSPAVNGRQVFGQLEKWDAVWRAGANANTTFTTTEDILVEGKPLPAGTYGVHMIPREKGAWTVIFSKFSDAWGSFFYDEKEDALRVDVTPRAIDNQEYLEYVFAARGKDFTTLEMRWEKVAVALKISVALKEQVIAGIKKQMRNVPFWGWTGPYNAAQYLFTEKLDDEYALQLVDRSIAVQETFSNLMLKSQLLERKGNTTEAATLKTRAREIATPIEAVNYAFGLITGPDKSKQAEAFSMLNDIVKKDPKNYRYHAWMGQAYQQIGDKKNAILWYKKSLELVPADRKARIEALLKQVEG